MGLTALVAVGVAVALDVSVEEFPTAVHPVALFGALVEQVERPWSSPRFVGVLVALVFPLGAAVFAGGVTLIAVQFGPLVGAFVAGLVLFSTISLRMLLTVAQDVIVQTTQDTAGARESVRALVGRDTVGLSAGELRSAAIESAAENLSDGLVAPLFAFAAGAQISLAAGVAGAAWVKAINTLDSMLGYRSRPLGWASARLDDLVMWIPARLSAVFIALAGGSPGALVRARRWHSLPASPNSGWPMATLAAVLDVKLSKPGAYTLNQSAEAPTVEQAIRGVRVVGLAGVAAICLAGVVVWY